MLAFCLDNYVGNHRDLAVVVFEHEVASTKHNDFPYCAIAETYHSYMLPATMKTETSAVGSLQILRAHGRSYPVGQPFGELPPSPLGVCDAGVQKTRL